MKLILLIMTITIFATSLVSAQSAKQNNALEREIRKLDASDADAVLRSDLTALDKIWAEDFTVNNPASSSDPFPDFSKDKVKQLQIPILIVTGENTIKLHKFVNEKLARLLPKAERATIPKAGHGSARENPPAFNEAVLKFLKRKP